MVLWKGFGGRCWIIDLDLLGEGFCGLFGFGLGDFNILIRMRVSLHYPGVGGKDFVCVGFFMKHS